MHGDGFHADAFGHFRDVDGNDGIFVPAGAELDGQRNFHGGADRLENIFEKLKLAEQTAAAGPHGNVGYDARELNGRGRAATPGERRGPWPPRPLSLLYDDSSAAH